MYKHFISLLHFIVVLVVIDRCAILEVLDFLGQDIYTKSANIIHAYSPILGSGKPFPKNKQ